MTSKAVPEHIAAIRREGDLIVAAIHGADLDAKVPTCPDWTLRELVHHTGRTHRWAATHVERALTEALPEAEQSAVWGEMPADPDLAEWYHESNARLARALEDAPDDLACWAFLPAPSPLAFWARRQAHETAIHRVDTQIGAGVAVDPVPPAFGLDGIDEILCGFFSRYPNRVRTEIPRTFAVRPTDGDGEWVVRMGPEGTRGERGTGDTDCTVRGPANDLYLALWNRRPTNGLDIAGDRDVLDRWADKATITWS
jgi:uncharacterized protein (TIGR03083 family)